MASSVLDEDESTSHSFNGSESYASTLSTSAGCSSGGPGGSQSGGPDSDEDEDEGGRRRRAPPPAPSAGPCGPNVVKKLFNREIYGRVANTPRSKTEPLMNHVHHKCKMSIKDLIPDPEYYNHIYMGFTLCGRYFISYKEIMEDMGIFPSVEYELYVWRFSPGKPLNFVSKHRIFKLLKGPELDEIMFLQYPSDPYKLYCYGIGITNPGMAYLTILTLPFEDNCRFCNENTNDSLLSQGWCLTHGFMLHYMFTMSQPIPAFDPNISFSFPDHIVINTGHYIHILNTSCYKPNPAMQINVLPTNCKDEEKTSYADNMSEVSESASDNFSTNSVVEAILEDFSEYDLEGGDCSKPFHELNISCDPLNVTGRSYHNALVQNIVDPRLKRLLPQTSKNVDKPKIDRKIAEKAYEFTEENEKCEKLSSFRKKRLADKKYEFSEDNSENIVPFNSLRRDRRYLYKPSKPGIFLSPRSPGIRSPMQSPNSRSPASRSIYTLRSSPHHSKSPISPRENARKFNVYSPSADGDCSDCDSKLVLRQINNLSNSHHIMSTDCISGGGCNRMQQQLGLLIVDSRKDDLSKWVKKVVRRYSSVDFENSSLVSGQSRDDYNIPIEIPLMVQTLTDQHLDIVPEFKADQVMETQLIVTQRSFDCEQFVQIRAQKLCSEQQLEFLHCEDYDIKLLHICPLDGHIVCQAVIKIGALKLTESNSVPKPYFYESTCLFTWNILTDVFELIEPQDGPRLQLIKSCPPRPHVGIPKINGRQLLVMDINYNTTKLSLRDYNNRYEVVMDDYGDIYSADAASIASDFSW